MQEIVYRTNIKLPYRTALKVESLALERGLTYSQMVEAIVKENIHNYLHPQRIINLGE